MSIINEIQDAINQYLMLDRNDSECILIVPIEYIGTLIAEINTYGYSFVMSFDDIKQCIENNETFSFYGYPVVFRNCDEIMLVKDDRK